MSRPRVAHLIRTWVAPSETFIVSQVRGSTLTEPVVVARKERSGARELLEGLAPPPGEASALLLTGDGLSSVARTVADLAWRVRLLTETEGARMAARLTAAGVALLHAHFGTDAAFFAPVWRRLRLPRVASFYGYDAWKTGRRAFGLGRRYLARVFAGFDVLLVPSQDMHDDLVALGAPPEKVTRLPWGIDVERFAPTLAEAAADAIEGHAGSFAAGAAADAVVAASTPASAAAPAPGVGAPLRVISVCRFIEKKGLSDAIGAVAELLRGGLAAEYRLVGDGPLAEVLAAQAKALGIADRVRFEGFVAPERLPGLLRQHDVFLHPSVTAADGDKEGVPTAILEAAACGLPVVATRHGGIPEAVADGATGLLVREHDVAALSAALRSLANDAPRRRALGASGRALVARQFDLATQNRRREELCLERIEHSRRHGARETSAGASSAVTIPGGGAPRGGEVEG